MQHTTNLSPGIIDVSILSALSIPQVTSPLPTAAEKSASSYQKYQQLNTWQHLHFSGFALLHSQDQREKEIEFSENVATSHSAAPQSHMAPITIPSKNCSQDGWETPAHVMLSFLLGDWIAASTYIHLHTTLITSCMLILPLSWFRCPTGS